ncbi:MAG: hypothetical protein WC866_04680 [Patescibacteria group bacterium]|jgi:hypothetical protein
MTDTQHARTQLRYSPDFDIWIIKSFVIVTLSVLLMLLVAGIEEASHTVSTELSRYEPTIDMVIPANNAPFRANGPNLAFAEGVRP